jgi:hypothetical protein
VVIETLRGREIGEEELVGELEYHIDKVCRGSSGLLLLVSLRSRLWISSFGALTKRGLREVSAPASDDSTYSSSKANPSSFSNLAMLLLVYLSSPWLEYLGRD